MTRSRSRLAIALGTALLAIGLLAPPAHAEQATTPDPRGDGHGSGDIRAVRISQDKGGALYIRIRTELGINLQSAPSWASASSISSLRINLDTTGDNAVDWTVTVTADEGGPNVSIQGSTSNPTPRAPCVADDQPLPTYIRLRIAQGCIELPAHARAFARYRFDRGGDGTINSDDRGPNGGYTPFIDILN